MKNKHAGFTLIELMITLLLSSMLIAAIGKVFIDSSNSFRKQKTLSYLIEDGRYAQEAVTKEFRRTRFLINRNAAGSLPADVFIKDIDVLGSGLTLESEAFIRADFNGAGFAGDVFDINHLIFRYQLNDINDLPVGSSPFDASACTRNIHLTAGEDPAIENIVVTLYFYIAFDQTLSTPVLYCAAKRENLDFPATASKNPVSSAIPLASNVERMYILYGIDTSGDTFANQYLQADQVEKSSLWLKVVSIRLYLVLGSEDKNISYKIPGYTVDGRNYTVNAPDDKRLYRVFSYTIAMRNH